MKSIFLIVILSLSIFGQDDDRDTQGKDFWLTFMPNTHVANGSPSVRPFRDSLYIFMASNVPANVTIDYTDGAGVTYQEVINITDVFEYETFKLAWSNFELPDGQEDRWNAGYDYNQGRAPQSFHITSDEKITVIAHNQAVWSSDGMIVYPTPTLGSKYFLNTYNSFVQSSFGGTDIDFKSAQFAIVATEDDTEIFINPNEELTESGGEDITVSLDRGEVYLAQASSINRTADLTGTYVESDKPIAVFSGNERAYVPSIGRGSKDYLTAQMIPVESSGKRYICLPFVEPSVKDPGDVYNDLYRVLAYNDNTEIYINGQLEAILDRSEFYEGITTDEAVLVEANQTVSVYQLKKSTNYDNNINAIGDPFMLLNVAESQFYNSYKIINFQSSEYQGEGSNGSIFNEVYENQYISFAINKDLVDQVLFDFQPLSPDVEFKEVPNSDYVFATLEVELGTHLLTAPEGFICYAYGYGYANSYGFVGGGLRLELLDHNTPTKRISGRDCYIEEGVFADSSYLDSGIERIEILTQDNIDFSYEIIGDSIPTLEYSAQIIDQEQSGELIYRVYDEFGLWLTDTISIGGFTVALTPASDSEIVDDAPGIPINRTKTFEYEIVNYGSYTITISDIEYDDTQLILSDINFPITLAPDEIFILQFEFLPNGEPQLFTDQIELKTDCDNKPIGTVRIATWTDELDPVTIYDEQSDCNPEFAKSFQLLIEDIGEKQFGLENIQIDTQDNLLLSTSFEYPDFVEITGNLIDPFNDGFIQVTALDSAGNETVWEELLSGLTLSLKDGSTNIDFGEITENTTSCRFIILENYGESELKIEEFDLGINPYFSIPAAQFPLVIPPKTDIELEICFNPEEVTDIEEVDFAQIILEECLILDIDMRGLAIGYLSESNSRCELNVRFFSDNIPNFRFADEAFPNPVSESTTIKLGYPVAENVSIDLYSTTGDMVQSLYYGEIQAGISEINLQFGDIENGSYLLLIRSAGFQEAKTILLNR